MIGYGYKKPLESKWELVWDDSPGVELRTEMDGDRKDVQDYAKRMAEDIGVPIMVRKYEYFEGKYRKGWIAIEGFMVFPTRWTTKRVRIESEEQEV